MKIYAGNLSKTITEQELQRAFEDYGEVSNVQIVRDPISKQPWGYGFVMMPNRLEAKEAVEEMNGQDLMGQTVTVEKSRRSPRGFQKSSKSKINKR